MAGPRRSSSSPLIIDIPPRVLGQFCDCIDSLTDWEWLRFVSNIMEDETTVQRFLKKRQAGDIATRELLWSWGQKLATVQDLEEILQKLELYRALEILRQGSSVAIGSSARQARESCGTESPMNGTGETKKVTDNGASFLPGPPNPPSELLRSLQDNGISSSEEKALSIPQQEISLAVGGACQQWAPQQLRDLTDGFSPDRRIFSGQFADIYLGQKDNRLYAVKRLKEVNGEQTDRFDSFFQTEAKISFGCRHPNLLLLLGFCLDSGHRCLVTHYMKNGSLDAALRAEAPRVLSWERRLGVAAGLLRAVRHLHEAGLLHGNIKSSNVFLDEDFSPKLGHSGPRFCPDKSANYTQIKTEELQRYQPYLPDTYLRRGQLTTHTDLFSVGVVFAELVTGLKPCDKTQDPAYLKDLIVQEMEETRACVESSSSKPESPEHLCAERITRKYHDARPGRPPGAAAFYLANAACMCLTKKKVLIEEVIAMIEKAQRECEGERHRGAEEEPSSMNVPEESYFHDPLSAGCPPDKKMPPSPAQAFGTPPPRSTCHLLASSDIPPRTPCELDESGNYLLTPSGEWQDLGNDVAYCNALPMPSTSGRPASHTANLNSPSESEEPSWGIEVNEAKMRLMENIELYEDEKLDSAFLFES